MNFVAALLLFNILILIYQILIEIFTSLCRLTGMSYEKAKFQVISLLTGTGFTTIESEGMILTKQRRRLAQTIMLFSYIFNISIVSIIVNVFMATSSSSITELKLGLLFTLWNIFIIFILKKFKITRKFVDKLAIKISDSKSKRKENYITVYDTFGHKIIAEIEVRNIKEEMKGKTIEENQLKSKYNIQLLVIKRREEVISHITPDTIIQENDTIIVFGDIKAIKLALVKMFDKK